MAFPLVKHLGVRATLSVVNALGQLAGPDEERSGAVMGRKKFLRFGAGAVIAAGIVATGNMPAFARSGNSKALAWVEANSHRLPQRYDDIVKHDMPYRRAIFAELAPDTQRSMWFDHVNNYRAAHSNLNAEQNAALDRVVALIRDCPFTEQPKEGSPFQRAAKEVNERVVKAFGKDQARAILTTLGPADQVGTDGVLCQCSDQCHDWCEGSRYCKYGGCDFTRSCCTLWQWVCNGFCNT